MMAIVAALLSLLLAAAPARADEARFHRMLSADGTADTAKCAVCHDDDLSLSRSQVDTCTLCHAATVHGGAAEHLRATAAAVAKRLAALTADAPALPLTDAGGIYCGTCHLFHDPRISNEPLVTRGPRSSSPVARAIRDAIAAGWPELATTHGEAQPGARFSDGATRALRLPVDDGTLCRHCHGSGGR